MFPCFLDHWVLYYVFTTTTNNNDNKDDEDVKPDDIDIDYY